MVVTWEPAVESDVDHYLVTWGPPDAPPEETMTVSDATATLRGVRQGWIISVKAVNDRGLEGWDWARTQVGSRE
jgi:hypothetical protein